MSLKTYYRGPGEAHKEMQRRLAKRKTHALGLGMRTTVCGKDTRKRRFELEIVPDEWTCEKCIHILKKY